MRQLKFHEQKLLKKVDFLQWKSDSLLRETKILRRYHIQDREDYHKYNKLCGRITKMVAMLKKLDAEDPARIQMSEKLLEKCFRMGLIPAKKSLTQCEQIAASCFARRRIPVVLVKNKFCETMREAVSFVEQGHIRVGPEVVTDPAFHVVRDMEDFITWVDTSKVKRQIAKYSDTVDDYDLMQA